MRLFFKEAPLSQSESVGTQLEDCAPVRNGPRQRWAVIVASPNHVDAGERLSSWHPAERFTDALLIDDKVGLRDVCADVRTCLLLDASSGARRPHWVAAGMVLALGRIRRHDRDAVVGFLPSLAHAAHVAQFGDACDRAYDVASENPRRLVVAGAIPDVGKTAAEALVLNAFGRAPHVAAVQAQPGQPRWREVSMTVGTVDAFRSSLLAVDPSLAALIDGIASSSSIKGEARILRAAADRAAVWPYLPLAATRARQTCLAVPLTR